MIRCVLLVVFVSLVVVEPKRVRRILGGIDAEITDHPHQLSVRINGKHTCGGVLVSQKFGITAAQCINGLKPYEVTVLAGSSWRHSGGVVKTAKALTKHPKFDEKTLDYDIAVIEFSSPVKYNDEIKNITLATEEPLAGSKVQITGWGATDDGDPVLPLYLQGLSIEIIDRDFCQERLTQYYKTITPNMICAGNLEGRRDSCQGDSGGPLVDGKGVLVGLVSFGVSCGRRNTPSVYTNIAALRDWVNLNVQE